MIDRAIYKTSEFVNIRFLNQSLKQILDNTILRGKFTSHIVQKNSTSKFQKFLIIQELSESYLTSHAIVEILRVQLYFDEKLIAA